MEEKKTKLEEENTTKYWEIVDLLNNVNLNNVKLGQVINLRNLRPDNIQHLLDKGDLIKLKTIQGLVIPGHISAYQVMSTVQTGETPLFAASFRGDETMSKRLLEEGADINAIDEHGWTCLYNATIHNNIPMVKFLLAHGARDIKSNGETPSEFAKRRGFSELVSLFENKNKV